MGKEDAGSRLQGNVPENHFLYGGGRPPVIGYPHNLTVGSRLGALPGIEDFFNRKIKLFKRVADDINPGVDDHFFVGHRHLPHLHAGEFPFKRNAGPSLEFTDDGIKVISFQS